LKLTMTMDRRGMPIIRGLRIAEAP
jgi:hypothetical protein